MDSLHLSRLLIRLFALFLFSWTVSTSPWLFSYYIAAETRSFLYFASTVLIPLILPLLATIGLWVFAGALSRVVNPEDETVSFEGFSEEKSYLFGLFFLGVYVALFALIDLVAHLTSAYLQLHSGDFRIESVMLYPDLLATVVELFLGMFIALQRKGILRLVCLLRGR